MPRSFTLDFWIDDGWYVGKLREAPDVFSQGESLDELEEQYPRRLPAHAERDPW